MFFTYWDDLGSTPARVNRFTGEIQINNRYFATMPEFYKKFIIEHEKGHFLTDTRSEFKADKYAFKHVVGTAPRSLKNSVFSISRVLSFRNPEHMERLAELVRMALEYDYNKNGNTKAKEGLNILNQLIENQKTNIYMSTQSDRSYFEPQYPMSGFDDLYDNARGKARRQARKAARVAKRSTRVAARQQRKQTRVEGRVARRQTRVANRASNNYLDNQPILSPEEQYTESAYAEQNQAYPQAEQYTEPVDNSVEEIQEYPEAESVEEMDSYFGDDGECLDDSYYGDEYDNGAGKARRQARRAKRQEQKEKKKDLKNDRLAAKNEIKLSRADAKRTKADAKKTLADQGKSGTDWIGGAVSGVLGLFGKKSETTDPNADPALAGAADPAASDGKLMGMPKGVAIAVIVVLILIVVGVVIYFVKKKKA